MTLEPQSPAGITAGPTRSGFLLRSLARIVLALAAVLTALALWIVQPLLWHDATANQPAVDPAQLHRDVQTLVERFPQRCDAKPEVLAQAADWIATELRQAGGRVTLQPYPVEGATFVNVRARFGPPSGEVVVVGAHYDTCMGLPGADDNASGVAGLLAVARLLGQHPPQAAVELVAYTLEEPPHFRKPTMGSAVHVRALQQEGVAVRAMISLEMLGTFDDAPDSQSYPAPALGVVYPTRGDFIVVVGDFASPLLVRKIKGAMQPVSPLPVWSINAPALLPGVDFSDHRNYWAAGIPAVMVTDTSFFRNKRYHTVRDTPDRLDYPRMAQVVQGVHAAVRQLAD